LDFRLGNPPQWIKGYVSFLIFSKELLLSTVELSAKDKDLNKLAAISPPKAKLLFPLSRVLSKVRNNTAQKQYGKQ
jgi:hypothetical protein